MDVKIIDYNFKKLLIKEVYFIPALKGRRPNTFIIHMNIHKSYKKALVEKVAWSPCRRYLSNGCIRYYVPTKHNALIIPLSILY